MIIEITQPETEALIHRCFEQGKFRTIDELLGEALVRMLKESQEGHTGPKKRQGRKSLAELFAESPFKGLSLEFDESEQDKDFGRDIEL